MGVLLVWGCLFLSVVSVTEAASGGPTGGLIALPVNALLIALGVRLFRRSIFRLNQVDLVLGEIPLPPSAYRNRSL
jgi:hypothetical protein